MLSARRQTATMATRERLRDVSTARAQQLRILAGNEIRTARLNHDLSQHSISAATGIRQAKVSLIERGLAVTVRLGDLVSLCAAVGLDLSVRAFPAGLPIRDAARVALLGKLRAILPSHLSWRTEVPLPLRGDWRAWDAIIAIACSRSAWRPRRACGTCKRSPGVSRSRSGMPESTALCSSSGPPVRTSLSFAPSDPRSKRRFPCPRTLRSRPLQPAETQGATRSCCFDPPSGSISS